MKIKAYLFAIVLINVVEVAICQVKSIELSRIFRQEVPDGKVWTISNKKAYKVIFSNGVSRSGTSCNAAFHSNPAYIYGISYIEQPADKNTKPKTIGFTFKDSPTQVDEEVYLLKPYLMMRWAV